MSSSASKAPRMASKTSFSEYEFFCVVCYLCFEGVHNQGHVMVLLNIKLKQQAGPLNFAGFPNHSPPLTLLERLALCIQTGLQQFTIIYSCCP